MRERDGQRWREGESEREIEREGSVDGWRERREVGLEVE